MGEGAGESARVWEMDLEFAVTREVENMLGADSGGKKVKIALFVGKLDVANAREQTGGSKRP